MHELNISRPPPGTPGPIALPDIDIIQGALSNAAFTDIQYERLNVTFESQYRLPNFLHRIRFHYKDGLTKNMKEML